jgi:hypothetical protein
MAKNKGMVAGQGKAKTTAPSKQVITETMEFKKDTPGTFAYEVNLDGKSADDAGVGCASIYIRKAKAAKQYKKAKVTIELFD